MAATYLTAGREAMWRAVIAGLVAEGHAFNPLTTSMSAYLATVLAAKTGQIKSNLKLSVNQLLAQILVTYGVTSASALTMNQEQLLGGLYDAISVTTPSTAGQSIGLLLILTKAT